MPPSDTVTVAAPGRPPRLLLPVYAISGLAVLTLCILNSGVYDGLVDGWLFPGQESLRMVAQTAPRWYWLKPSTFTYDRVTLRHLSDENAVMDVDLVARTWHVGTKTGPLDADALARFIAERGDAHGAKRQAVEHSESILSTLASLHDGTFHPPRHHGYDSEVPFRARCQHFALGLNLGIPLFWLWLAVWPACLLIWHRRMRPLRPSPWKVYVLTLGVVVTADLVCYLVWSAVSPSPISESMEMLTGLVNLPALVLLGESLGLSFLATGAAMWATAVSMLAVVLGPARPKAPEQHGQA